MNNDVAERYEKSQVIKCENKHFRIKSNIKNSQTTSR